MELAQVAASRSGGILKTTATPFSPTKHAWKGHTYTKGGWVEGRKVRKARARETLTAVLSVGESDPGYTGILVQSGHTSRNWGKSKHCGELEEA